MTTSLAPSPTLHAYDQHVDGLFTYCLSVLCRHDAALAAVTELRDLALRHGDRLADPGLRRAWLYALARHCCLRRLEQGVSSAAPPAEQTEQYRRELASLAWPEAAGTDPAQREALELAVRHRLTVAEVAAVLGLGVLAAEGLLAAAGAEVARTRAALLVLGVGSCPELAQLGGVGAESWRDWVLGPALRRELVQHVADCPTCRGTAERVSGELGDGLAGLPGLTVLTAPVVVRIAGTAGRVPGGAAGAAFLAGAAAGRRVTAAATEDIRFDPRGFPRHRAPSGGRSMAVRQRVLTTGVLAAVLAAPVAALWVANRGTAGDAATVSSVRVDAEPPAVATAPQSPGRAPSLPAVQAPGADLALAGNVSAETLLHSRPARPTPHANPTEAPWAQQAPAAPPAAAPGQLTVEAAAFGSRTVLTLTNSGGTEIQWHAVLNADWLRLSRDSGVLAPGQRITVTVTVDDQRAPQGHWSARIALPPSEAVVTVEGDGPAHRSPSPTPTPPTPTPTPTHSASPSPSPSSSPSGRPSASASPSPKPTR